MPIKECCSGLGWMCGRSFASLFQVYLKHIPFWEFIFTNRALQGITNLHLWDLLSIAHDCLTLSDAACQDLCSAWWGMVELQHFGSKRIHPRHNKTNLLMVKALCSSNLSTRSLPKYLKWTGVSWREVWGKILNDGGYSERERSLPIMEPPGIAI